MAKWLWKINYCKKRKQPLEIGWEIAEKAWQKKEMKNHSKNEEQLTRLYEWVKKDQSKIVAMEATIVGILALISLGVILAFVIHLMKR